MTFPLPDGCRSVCRPKRTYTRHFTISALYRVVKSIIDNNTASLDEICATMSRFPELSNHCKPECERLKQLVDDWLREMEQIKQTTGILDEFVTDILGVFE